MNATHHNPSSSLSGVPIQQANIALGQSGGDYIPWKKAHFKDQAKITNTVWYFNIIFILAWTGLLQFDIEDST